MTGHFWSLSPELILQHRCVRGRKEGFSAAPQTASSVWRSPTSQRHHALSVSFPLPALGRDKRSRDIGHRHALYGVPGPEPFGLPEVGLWWPAGEHNIQTGGQHNRLGWLWLQSEWRHEGLRYHYGGIWTQWNLLLSKYQLWIPCAAVCCMFILDNLTVLSWFFVFNSKHNTVSFCFFLRSFRIIMPQGTPCLWWTSSRATHWSLWVKAAVKPSWPFKGPSCHVMTKTSTSLWDIQTSSPSFLQQNRFCVCDS